MPRLRNRSVGQECEPHESKSENKQEGSIKLCEFVIDRDCKPVQSVSDQLNTVNTEVNSPEINDATVTELAEVETDNGDHKLELNCTTEKIKHIIKSGVLPKRSTKNTQKKLGLSCSLQDGMKESLYISNNRKHKSLRPNMDSSIDQLMKSTVLPSDVEKQHNLPPYEVSLNQTRKQRQKERSQTKGNSWFDMKAPEMTEEKKNDLSVLQMRRVLDPKHFYKNPDIRALPKFFQMGKIVEDPSDFYSARIPKKQRKRTLVDELLDDTEFRRYNKKKYTEITQKAQASHARKGAAKHMKRLKKSKKSRK